jgi:hypothetical protein
LIRYLVQIGNVALFAVILGQYAGCACSQNIPRTGSGDAAHGAT